MGNQPYQQIPIESDPESIQQQNNNNNNNNNINNNNNNANYINATPIHYQQQQHYVYNINRFQDFYIKKNPGYLDFLHGFDESYPIDIANKFSNTMNQSNYIQLIQNLNSICKPDQEKLKRNSIIIIIIFFVSFFFFLPIGFLLDVVLFVIISSFLFRIDSQMEVFISNYNSANISNGISIVYIKSIFKREIKLSLIENQSSSQTNIINMNNNYDGSSNNNNLYIIPQQQPQQQQQNNTDNDDPKINLID
ncbi:hypothetical protein DICPUDRAFT_100150 [Dictyostelium purpureum]|uniref:Uncharacterized protein n=1 Tax=Dictyostelium purpureum TaxID=5786 RepID=F1A608_DICPU|nr:uncharacterized protein DICPUDRAFT_100150 [Dictyostelium purpureum]EGC28372.1 hypothetical protein DICPUDRAFT_100150 [Dictyostelium purpureum]|eukprot:XP_003295102.1 hypothetical protein DICPUDRAFT_100150 [Dictyostelium purpureum]